MEQKNLQVINDGDFKITTYTFYSIEEVIKDTKKAIETHDDFYDNIMRFSGNWNATLDKEITKLLYGDKKLVNSFDATIKQEMISNGYITQKRSKRSFVGAGLNVARYINNDPFCFSRKQKTITLSKVVNLYIDLATSFRIPDNMRQKKFCDILAFAKSLELKNYNVNITLLTTHLYAGTNEAGFWFYKLKEADKKINLQTMSYTMGSSYFSRIFGYAYEETLHKLKDGSTACDSGLGVALSQAEDSDKPFYQKAKQEFYKVLERQNKDKNDSVLFLHYYSDLEKIKKEF